MADNDDERSQLKNWNIVDGVIPDDLTAIMDKMLEQRQNVVYPEPMAPPWEVVPEPLASMRWRMGGGEDYLDDYRKWFATLSAENRDAYVRSRPEPEGWNGFFETEVSRNALRERK